MKWLVYVCLMVLVGGMALSLSAQATGTIEIHRTNQRLVIFIGGNQPVNVSGLGFQTTINGQLQPPRYLKDYPVFNAVRLSNLPTPACFVIRVTADTDPLPLDCQNIQTNSIYRQNIQLGEVFWYDSPNLQPRTFSVYQDSQLLDDQCPDIPLCSINYPLGGVVEPTATPVIILPGGCVIDESSNILFSADTDGDGYSDFEELCILRTNYLETTPDIDEDGIPDQIETELAGFDPRWANPSIFDQDRDGDWLPDIAELSLGLYPDEVDTDKDKISDFIEYYWLGSDPKFAEVDSDGDSFPDILESYLPPGFPSNARCQVNITFRMDELWIAIPEESDGQDIIKGDEPSLTYELRLQSATNNNNYRQRWSGESIFKDDRIRNFAQIPARAALCGDTAIVQIEASEVDAPFGGIADFGVQEIVVPLIFQRFPIGANWRQPHDPIIFSGFVEDGDYDYRVYYTINIEMAR